MKFGIQLPNSGPIASASAITSVAQEAEALGYTSVWVHDHIERKLEHARHHFVAGAIELWEKDPTLLPHVYESLVTLSYLAGVTKKVSLGTGILVLPLRNPVVLAKQAAVLDDLSGGRLILGVGRGGGPYAREELAAIGEEERADQLRPVVKEWIEVLKAVWTQPKASYKGELIEFSDVEIFPKPVQKPSIPLYYGALGGPIGLKVVARSADGWFPMYMLPEELREKKEMISKFATEMGRDPSKIGMICEHYMSIAKDENEAIKRATKTLQGLSSYGPLAKSRKHSYSTSGRMFDPGRNLLGDADTIIKYIQEFERVGLETMVLRLVSFSVEDMLDQMRMFESQVMKSF